MPANDPEELLAVPTPQAQTDAVRVTRWDFAPGARTGPHRHEVDYVVVPLTDATIEIRTADGVTPGVMRAGESYARTAPVEHDLVNTGDAPLSFVEIELLR